MYSETSTGGSNGFCRWGRERAGGAVCGCGRWVRQSEAAQRGAPVPVKAGPGTFYGLQIVNMQGAAAFIQVFDAASAGAVVLGTTLPDLEFIIGANTASYSFLPPQGVAFSQGIVVAATTAEAGGTASAAGVSVFVEYA